MREAMLAAVILAAVQAQAAACPQHTMKRSQCVLEGDLDLTSTMYLAPNTHLNCQGHTIRP